MKNLANCEPVEFLVQTNKIRKALSKWLSDTEVMQIRKNLPTLTDDMSDNEKKEALRKQAKINLSEMLDVALEKHAKETAELLGLLCFVEPKDLNKHKITEYLKEFGEIISDKDVLDFFTSLMRLENSGILTTVTK